MQFFLRLFNKEGEIIIKIGVLLGPASCKLFSAVFITLFALHVSDVIHIHPQERYKIYMQMVQVSARVS